jgi:glycosyltransferase involved in cell wall biosynthesis
MKSNKKKLSIILPSYNEEKNIQDTFITVIKSLKKCSILNFEIIFIDDGSTDNSKNEIKYIVNKFDKKIKFKFQLFKKNFGLGKAFRSGINLASGSHVMFIPTDNYHPSKGLVEILKKINWNDDILLSYVKNIENRSIFRRFISRLYTLILNILFLNKIKYFNGLNIYPKEILKKFINKTNGFAFQTEIIIKAIRNGYSYYHVPTSVSNRKEGLTRAFKVKNIYQVCMSIIKLYFN